MYSNSLARHFSSMFHAKCLLPRLDRLLPVRSCLQNFYQCCDGNGTKVKIPSEIKPPLAWNHQPSYNNDPLHRCCLGTSWRRSSMALWNEVLFTKDPKAISSQQPLLSRILAKYQTFHVTYKLKISSVNLQLASVINNCPLKWGTF